MSARLLGLVGVLAATPAPAAVLTVHVEGIAERQGEILVAVCDRSFDRAGCPMGAQRAPTADSEAFQFPDLTPGSYAVAVFHDLNGNGELDRTALGLPSEPYGFSNDVGRFSPPSFERALVRVDDREASVVVSLGRVFEAR